MNANQKSLNLTYINNAFKGAPQRGKCKDEILHELGQFLEVMIKCNDSKDITIGSFFHWIKPAILHDQYLFISSHGDLEPSSYILWAWVSDKTLKEYFTQNRFALHPMSWNEGNNLIIVDYQTSDKNLSLSVIRDLYRKARNQAGISFRLINFSIRNQMGIVVKHNRKKAYGY